MLPYLMNYYDGIIANEENEAFVKTLLIALILGIRHNIILASTIIIRNVGSGVPIGIVTALIFEFKCKITSYICNKMKMLQFDWYWYL